MTRIIFMGTPDFAVPSLEALHNDAGKVVAAFSQPPRPAGRGKNVSYSPVHQTCMRMAIPCFTPQSLKDGAYTEILAMRPDFIVVAAFGMLLPKNILDVAPCLNVHASLLPRWRGAAPVQRAIMAGDAETGVTIMRMDEGLDTGEMLLKDSMTIDPNANSDDVTSDLAHMGAHLIVEAVNNFSRLIPEKQDDTQSTYAKKIKKSEAVIDWNDSAETIVNKVRALAPYPGVKMRHGDEDIKILKADALPGHADAAPGEVINDKFHIACGSGVLAPQLVQRPGKKIMPIADCLRGML